MSDSIWNNTMALTFTTRTLKSPGTTQNIPASGPKKGHSKALPIAIIDLQQPGRLRIGHLMTLFSVSHSTLYNHIRKGRIPVADGDDGKRPFWNTETVRNALKCSKTVL